MTQCHIGAVRSRHPGRSGGVGAQRRASRTPPPRVRAVTIGRDGALRAYQAALTEPTPAALDALGDALDEAVEVVGVVGPGSGLDQVRHALEHPRRPGFLASATWSAAKRADDGAVLEVALAPGGPVERLTIEVEFRGERISRVRQLVTMAPPPEPIALALTEELRATVDGALEAGVPLVLAYVDADGAPHLSLRGSTSAHGDTQLAIWVRDPTGGLLRAIDANPRVALLYRDAAKGTSYSSQGGRTSTTRPRSARRSTRGPQRSSGTSTRDAAAAPSSSTSTGSRAPERRAGFAWREATEPGA